MQHLRDLKQETSLFVVILVNMSSWNFVLSWVEHEKKFYNLGPGSKSFDTQIVLLKDPFWKSWLKKTHSMYSCFAHFLIFKNYHLIRGNFCRLLTTFANSLDPDQDRQVLSVLIWFKTVWHYNSAPERLFLKKLILKKKLSGRPKSMKNYHLIRVKFCRLLITFANSLDPDQGRQNLSVLTCSDTVWHPDSDSERCFLIIYFFLRKVNFDKQQKSADGNKSMTNYPACNESNAHY